MNDEKDLFADGNVRVTTRRVIIGETTYALANITSVSRLVAPRPLLIVLLAVFIALSGTSCILLMDLSTVGFVELGVAAVFGALYIYWPIKHWVRIGTAGSEFNAIAGEQKWADAVVSAINDAIVRR